LDLGNFCFSKIRSLKSCFSFSLSELFFFVCGRSPHSLNALRENFAEQMTGLFCLLVFAFRKIPQCEILLPEF